MNQKINSFLDIPPGSSKLIYGLLIYRQFDENYSVGAVVYQREDLVTYLDAYVKADSSQYDGFVFGTVRPPAEVRSTHVIKSIEQYNKLLKYAKDNKLYVYYAKVGDGDNIIMPWFIDWNSHENTHHFKPFELNEFKQVIKEEPIRVPEVEEIEEPEEPDGIFCPYCDKKLNSTSGRTLHVKNKHPDKFAEYQQS